MRFWEVVQELESAYVSSYFAVISRHWTGQSSYWKISHKLVKRSGMSMVDKVDVFSSICFLLDPKYVEFNTCGPSDG